MARTEQEQKMLDNMVALAADGQVTEETLKAMKQYVRKQEKARKAAAFREKMRTSIPHRLLDVFPIDADREDLNDIGQAKKFANVYQDSIRYTKEYGWLFYQREGSDGGRWLKNALEQVKKLYHDFNDDQVHEALNMLADAPDDHSDEAQAATKYLNFALKMRTANMVGKVLEQAKPYVQTEVDELDANPYMLNTPSGLIDLRTGAIRPTKPDDLCTRITKCGMSTDDEAAAREWQLFLTTVTDGNGDIEAYLWNVIGRAAFGVVKAQELVILYGNGANGKSTLMNAIAEVLGDYVVTIDGEALMDDKGASADFNRARLHGARLALFTELKENRTLDTATLKRIASTDRVQAAIKYQMPFDFKPSHSAILFSNHLPFVNARDEGTWRRLKIIPFNHHFERKGEKLNYAEMLVDRCGGYILAWIVNGAMMAAANEYQVDEPQEVKDMVKQYRKDSDWLADFLEDRCDIDQEDDSFTVKVGDLYRAYQSWCMAEGGKMLSVNALSRALESQGFRKHRDNKGRYFKGLQLKIDVD